MSIKNQSPIPSLLNFDFASEMELWNTLEYYCGTHKAHKYENKWREGWTERTLLFNLVDGRVISQVGKRADPDFLQKVYSIVEAQHVWNWLSTCWHWKGTKKPGVLNSPFLSLPVMKDFSIGIGWGLSTDGESTTRRCRGTTRECRWISSTLITSGPSDQGRKSWIVLGAGKINRTVLFWGMSKMILFWETSSWWLITLGWASPSLVKTCFVQNESECDDKVPQVIIFEGQARHAKMSMDHCPSPENLNVWSLLL